MSYIDLIKNRRSVYDLSSTLPISEESFQQLVKDAVHWSPDAFNMNSTRAVIVSGENHQKLWDHVLAAFDGQVTEDRVAPFKAAYGTVLFFTDDAVVESLAQQFELYAANFPIWATQANGMAQVNVWNALSEAGIGASIQHYNPVIDAGVKELLGLPESWRLTAQMVVGGINSVPEAKDRGDINERVLVK